MSNIGAMSNTRAGTPPVATSAARPLAKFELDSKHYGPTVATAISVADTVGDAASAVYQFSEKSLQELARLPGEACDLAKDAVLTVGKAVDAVEDGVEDVASGVVSLASKGVWQVEHAYDTLERTANSLGRTLNAGLSVADKASDAVSDVVVNTAKELGASAATVAGYTALGLGAAASRLTDLL